MAQPPLLAEHEAQQGALELDKSVEISVVVPISEFHDDLRVLHDQIVRQLSTLGASHEILFILDGPKPEALETLQLLKQQVPGVTILSLNRSFGEAAALAVGIDNACGQIILTVAPYFQVEPHEIPRVIKTLIDEEHDLVVTRRHPRIDPLFNRVQSWIFHWLTRTLTGVTYHDISCGLRAMRRRAALEIPLYGDLHRFIPLLAHQRGLKVTELPVQQSPHNLGRRVYKPGVYLRRLLDIFTLFFLFKFTKKPLRFFGLIGSVLLGSGALITGYLGLSRLLGGGSIAGRPLLILGVLLMVLGVQLFSLGLLGEIIIFTHAGKTRDYTLKEDAE
jgi:glycosyltransferase involved in cell wall biosynthesis